MWCYIEKKNIEDFLNKYPHLVPMFDDISLYQTDDKVFFPRLLYKDFPHESLVVYKTDFNPARVMIRFNGVLRPAQEQIVNHLQKIYNKNRYINGIIKAPPGTGKTVLGVYLTHMLQMKTMVILDNSNLAKQWIEAYTTFTDIQREDIGIIGQSMETFQNKPVVIALVQTLISRIRSTKFRDFLTLIDKERFGLVIYDEVHVTSAAPKFSKSSLYFRTPNMIGLSATPFQSEAPKILMECTVGKVIYNVSQYEITPIYVLNYYDSGIGMKYNKVLYNTKIDYLTRKRMYDKLIVKSKIYYDTILSIVKKRLEQEHTILILCFTKKQVNSIYDTLAQEGIESTKFYGDERKEFDRDKVRVLIGTYEFIGKGFDFAKLSCLILATNLAGRKSLVQSIGRILRKYPNKPTPVVDDLIDVSLLKSSLNDVRIKKAIVTNEFKCEIRENKLYKGELA